MADVIVLPIIRTERVLAGEQRLLPSSDRRNIVQLARARDDRDQELARKGGRDERQDQGPR